MQKLWLVAVAVVAAAACGGDSAGPAAVLPDALTGEWVANSTCSPGCSFTLTSVANPNVHTDIVATGGFTIDLLLRSDGTAGLNLFGQTEVGTARVAGNTLILTSGGSSDTVDYAVTSTTLDLKFRTPFPFDLNNDGVIDAASGHAVLKKQ